MPERKYEDLTDEMKADIGVSSPPATFEVTAPGIRLFARALGYTDPIYYDVEEARKAGHRALPAPPGFFGSRVYKPSEGAVGQPRDRFGFARAIAGGVAVTPLAQVYDGDVLVGVTTTTDVQLRDSRMGQMLVTTLDTVYTNQDGVVVGKYRFIGLAY